MGDDPFMRNQNAAVRSATKGQNRTNVLQLKMMGQAHPTGLTPTLLKLFEARPPLEFKPPPEKRKMPSYAGIAQFVSHFAEKGDPEYAPPVPTAETPAERKARIHKLRLEKGAAKAAEELEKYDPTNDPNVSGDPYKTLFVARLNYETSESKVKREFESYGPIKRVRLITDKETGKPRGYAFIEYVHTRDMKGAYKQADGRKIDGRRVLVDVERGRTVPNWRPRRLGGGLGTSRVGGEDVPQREVQQTGRLSQSAEPRAKEDRHSEREREKSRERGLEREREREKSHERPKNREREDRHHRDRGKERDRDREHRRDGERDRDRGRERDRGRDSGRDKERDRDRDLGQEHDRDRDRHRGRDREYEDGDNERERSRDRHAEKDYDQAEPEDGWYEQPDLGHRRQDADRDHRYEHYESDRHDHNRYDQMDEDDYRYDRGASESRDYRHSERSRSREYDS